LGNADNRQTDRQTNTRESITSFAEIDTLHLTSKSNEKKALTGDANTARWL